MTAEQQNISTKANPMAKAKKAKRDVYQEITDKILSLLDEGTIPWRKPWAGKAAVPRSAATGKVYRGINLFLLHVQGYEQPKWITYQQAKKLGGQVRKGEKGSLVTFWKLWTHKDKETGEEKNIPVLRHYSVFNVQQVDDLPEKCMEEIDVETFEHDPIAECEAVVSKHCVDIRSGLSRAYYRPSSDTIAMPSENRFETREEYYSTLFHELIHWTAKRVGRKSEGTFGDDSYAFEELVAEFGAAMLCGYCGIETATLDNSAAYIDGWRKQLRKDSKLVVRAAGAAQKAVDYLLGVKFEDSEETNEKTKVTA